MTNKNKWLLSGGVVFILAIILAVTLNQGGLFKGSVTSISTPEDSKTIDVPISPADSTSDIAQSFAKSGQNTNAGLFTVNGVENNKEFDISGDSVLKDKVFTADNAEITFYRGSAVAEAARNPAFKGTLYFKAHARLVPARTPPAPPAPQAPTDLTVLPDSSTSTADSGSRDFAEPATKSVLTNPNIRPLIDSNVLEPIVPIINPAKVNLQIPLSSSIPYAHAATADGPTVQPISDWAYISNPPAPAPAPATAPEPAPAPAPAPKANEITVIEDSDGIFALTPGDYPDGDYIVNVYKINDVGEHILDFSFPLHIVGGSAPEVELTCVLPLVEYQGQCVDPVPACQNPPLHSVTCIDKIENGVKIYNYSFQCQTDYTRSGNLCVSNPVQVQPQVAAPAPAPTPAPIQKVVPVVVPAPAPIQPSAPVVTFAPAPAQPSAVVAQPSAQPCIVNGKTFYLAQGPDSAYCKDLQNAQVLQVDQPASTLGVRYTTALSAQRVLQELGGNFRTRNLQAKWYTKFNDADSVNSASTKEIADFRTVYANNILTGRINPKDHSIITLAPLDAVNIIEFLSIYQHTIESGTGVHTVINENSLPNDILQEYRRNPDWVWIAEAYSFGVKYKMISKNQYNMKTIFNFTTRGDMADFIAKFKAAIKANPALLPK